MKLGYMNTFYTKSGTWLVSLTWTNWTFGVFWMRMSSFSHRRQASKGALVIGVDCGPFEVTWQQK